MSTVVNFIPKARPDHPVLDFEVLREEGIRHLENLATEIWTDYNAHDPGITLLELLCYAITDLGYRTRMLPIEDLMAQKYPSEKIWFEATEILPNEPVTERDFRKLLIDVKGVKNAWLCKADPLDAPMTLCKKKIIFPDLLDEHGEFDRDAIKDFLIKYLHKDAAAITNAVIDQSILEIKDYQDKADASVAIEPLLQYITEEAIAQRTRVFVKEVLGNIINPAGDITLDPESPEFMLLVEIFQKHLFYHTKNTATQTDYFYPPSIPHTIYQFLTDEKLKNNFEDYMQASIVSYGDIHHVTITTDLAKAFFLYLSKNEKLNTQQQAFWDALIAKVGHEPTLEEIVKTALNAKLTTDLPVDEAIRDMVCNTIWEYMKEYALIGEYFTDENRDEITQTILNEDNIEFSNLDIFRIKIIHSILKDGFYIQSNDIASTAVEIHQYLYPNRESLVSYLHEHFCEFGIKEICAKPTEVVNLDADEDLIRLNGIYRVILDPDDDIDTANPKAVETVVQRALARLHAHRALCEDFIQPYVVERREVHICLNIDVAPDADERAVLAEVIWRLQEYLTPTVRFYTFQEMHAQGIPCDAIYNGPLLDGGFLNDAEVDAALLVQDYNHSDLLRIALGVPGVLGIRELKIKARPEEVGAVYTEGPKYFVKSGPSNCHPPFVKRKFNLCDSCFQVNKGVRSFPLTEAALQEQLDWLNLTRNCAYCADPGHPLPITGVYREDLDHYKSLQYDLPAVYGVGDNHISADATLLRQAQARQLQAYLAFYDQMLAAYLHQLGQVSHLLSVRQDADAPTRFLPALYEVPGMRALIEEQAVFATQPAAWDLVIATTLPEEADRLAVRTQLASLIASPTEYTGFSTLRGKLKTLLEAAYQDYIPTFLDYFWGLYVQDEQNNYIQYLQASAETPAQHQERRNMLLDHMLARFGETFTAYIHALLRPDNEPEDTPWRQDFAEYLRDKARFLREVDVLGAQRGKGYHYRKMNPYTHQPDVWNTDNVAGLKKRVSRLTGIESYLEQSLIAEPRYRLDILQTQSKQGNAQFRIVLRRRLGQDTAADNPEPSGALLYSPKFHSKKKAQEKANELYLEIWKTALYTIDDVDDDPEKSVITFTAAGVTLSSDPMGTEEAQGQLLLIQELVKPGSEEREGFHIVEHILLRPNDPKDHLLQLHLGCYPGETPYDPYSFWITVVLPGWTQRFKHKDFRHFFEQIFRAETPAHIAVRFCWLSLEDMYKFEDAFKRWLVEKAKCTPNECHVTDAANALIDLMNDQDCNCYCPDEPDPFSCDNCHQPPIVVVPVEPERPNEPPSVTNSPSANLGNHVHPQGN